MTDINLANLPLAKGGQALNRVIGTQVNDNGVSSLALFPLKTLSAAPGGRIAKLAITTTPTEPGEAQPARLTVYTDDGNSYPVAFTIPPGERGFFISDVECEQDTITPGEASLVRLTVTLDNGQKLAPITLSLPPGKDSLTITDTSVTQGPVEAGKPSKVTVTTTHSDGMQASYAYDAPPGAPGLVKTDVIKTHTTNVDAPVDLVSINKGGKDLAVHRQDTGEWKFFYPEDQSVHALTYSDADARPTTIRTQKSGWREKSTLIVQNDGFDDFNAPSIIAVDDAINAETARAQAAEANTIKTHTTNVDAPVDLVTVNKGGNDLAVRRQDTGEWKYFYPEDQSVHALTYSDADVRPTTIRTLKSGWRGKPTLIVQNDGFDDFNAPSTIAVEDAINAETERAKAAETRLLSPSGGTLSGDIDLHGTINGDNLTSKTLHLTVDGDNAQGQIQLLGTKNNPSTTLTTLAADGKTASLFLNADNSVTTACNTSLPEIILGDGLSGSGRIVMLSFVVSTGTGDVNFPVKFLSPPLVYTTIEPVPDSWGGVSTATVSRSSVTTDKFYVYVGRMRKHALAAGVTNLTILAIGRIS